MNLHHDREAFEEIMIGKCYQLLDRFSEDIDISYTAESGMPGEAKKKQLNIHLYMDKHLY